MSKGKVSLIGIGLLFLGALCVGQALSQDTGAAPGGGGGRGGRGGRGGGMGTFDPNVMRAAMETRMKEALGCTDEEYKVLQPKIDKVQTLSRDLRGGGMGGGMMGGRGGRGGPGGGGAPAAEPTTEVGKAGAALTKVLANKDAPAEEIKTALQALRDAKAKVKTELEAAVKALKEVLTVRQEAQMVQMGVIE